MKIIHLFYIFIILLVFSGCSKDNLTGITGNNYQNGSIALKIDKVSIPTDVQTLIAYLTSANYDTLSTSTDIGNDSLKIISFNNVPIGEWVLTVDAENSEGNIIYTGKTNVTIIEDQTVDIYLTLTRTGSGTGNVNIYINWENKWTDFYSNPVFTQDNSPDFPYSVRQPNVIFDGGIYKMWYLNLYNSAGSSIWYVESNDGINWHSIQNGPVLVQGDSGSWDDYSVAPGAIIKDGDYFKMYYNGFHDQYGKWNIGLAVSADGIHWEKYSEPVLMASDEEYQIGTSSVIKYNQTYFMYYSVCHYPYYNISLATSTDGINWIKYTNNPILTVTKDWEGTGIYSPSVLYNQGNFEMIYMNADANAFGSATSVDGVHWIKNDAPIFNINDTHNKWASRIAYPDLDILNSEFRLYYTGFKNYDDGVIAFASKK